MAKLSIFMKVSAGHYNLVRPYEEQTFENKYKNCQVFPYIIHLFDGLKNEYEHCQKRVSRESLDLALKSMERNIRNHSDELKQCVPGYYQKVFEEVEKILKTEEGNEGKNMSQERVILLEEWMEKTEKEGLGYE